MTPGGTSNIGPAAYDASTLLDRTHCHTCRKKESESVTLRRCAGCQLPLYCSRECQKEAWHKHHKYYCEKSAPLLKNGPEAASSTASSSPSGSTSNTDAFSAHQYAEFSLFRTMHSWTLEAITHAAIHLSHDGRGAERVRTRPIVLHFDMIPVKREGPPPKRPTPWNTWRLNIDNWSEEPLEALLERNPSVAPLCNDMHWQANAYFPELEAKDRAKYGERLIGYVLVSFDLRDSGMSVYSKFPLAALRDPDALQHSHAQAVLADFINLCVAYLNAGIPLLPFQTDPPISLPARGRWAKDQKSWAFDVLHTLDDPWDDQHEQSREILKGVPRFTSLHPSQIILHYLQLLG